MSIKSKTSSIGSNTSKNSVKLSETVNDENEPRARLCHLKKWQHFQGYGFNLHAERAKSGQHIGKVDINSPAESAGLKEGDRIVEVNYVNISNENHQQVVKRIRNGLTLDGTVNENEVVLLVVDNEADEHYKKLNIIVKHDSENVLKLTTIEKASDENKSDELETSNHNEPQATSEENTSITTATAEAEKEVIPSQQQENKLNTSKSSSSLASSAHSINNTTNTSSNNINNNNQDSLISNSSNNLNEILSVNDELDNKLSKKTESTSSASNLSANSSENQSRSSKSNAQTPTSQKKETTSNTSTHERHQIKPEIITTKSTHLINNATVDPFHKQLPDLKYQIDKNVFELFEACKNTNKRKDPINDFYNHNTFKCKNNKDLSYQSPMSIYSKINSSEKKPPARPPPPSLSATLNYRSISSKSDRSSYYFNYNNEDDKKNLDCYLEMSAAEFKTYLKSKNRNDPRIAPVDMKQKFQMFQDM